MAGNGMAAANGEGMRMASGKGLGQGVWMGKTYPSNLWCSLQAYPLTLVVGMSQIMNMRLCNAATIANMSQLPNAPNCNFMTAGLLGWPEL